MHVVAADSHQHGSAEYCVELDAVSTNTIVNRPETGSGLIVAGTARITLEASTHAVTDNQ